MTAIATSDGVRAPQVTAHRGAAAQGQLRFVNGVARLTVRTDPGQTDLMTATFTSPIPTIRAADGTIEVDYPVGARLLRRARPAEMVLNQRLPWTIEVRRGASHLDLQLADVALRALAVHGGASHLRLALPRPEGTVTIHLGSLSDLVVVRPGGVPVKVDLSGGVTKMRVDEDWYGAVGGGVVQRSGGYDEATDRYDIVIAGSASKLTVSAA